MSGISVDPARIGRRRAREKRQEQARIDALVGVMSTPAGRDFVWDLIDRRCGLLAVYYGDDVGVYRSEGRREVGHKLVEDLQAHCPEQYILMYNEQVVGLRNGLELERATADNDTGDE